MRGSNLFTTETGMVFFMCFVMLSGCTPVTKSAKWSCFYQREGESKECRIYYDENFTRALDGSTASIDYVAAEFKETLTVDKLCKAIKSDGYDISVKAPENTLEWLNELLTTPDLLDKIIEKKEIILYTPEMKKFDHLTNKYRSKSFKTLTTDEQNNIKSLNRLTVEGIYEQESPKAKYVIAVRSKVLPDEEENKDYLEKRKKENKSNTGYENLKYSIFEFDIDCLKRQYRVQGQFDYDDKDAKLEGAAFPFSGWVNIDDYMEGIFQRGCRPGKTKKTN